MPANASAMSVEEYLRTSFEGADCDFVDGEVVERNMGEALHATLQAHLARILYDLRIFRSPMTEIRVQITPSKYRVADVAAWLPGTAPGRGIPTVPPFLAVEILSPSDRTTRVIPRINDYLAAGVHWVWLIDPYEGNALVFSHSEPTGKLADVLRTDNPKIEIPLLDLLALADE